MDQSLKVRNLTASNSSPPLHSTLNSLPIKALTTCMYTMRLINFDKKCISRIIAKFPATNNLLVNSGHLVMTIDLFLSLT